MYTILKFPEILTISPHSDYTFVHISRHFRVFQVEKCAIFWEINHLHLRAFTIIFTKFNNLSLVLQQENPPTDTHCRCLPLHYKHMLPYLNLCHPS